jgi:sulfur carrier protein ThiS
MENGIVHSTVAINHKKLFRIHREKDIIKLTLENNLFLLQASKSGNEFSIYSDALSSNLIGKVVSNFMGTEYTIYISNEQVAVVLYETNILGLKGPRKMTIILAPTGQSFSNLLQTFKDNPDQVIVLRNKQPVWSEESQSFVLNFEGRVTLASVKNFQIVPDLDLGIIISFLSKLRLYCVAVWENWTGLFYA